MAGEVAHVVYAARLLTHLGEKVKDPAYWAGTLFPDIRHLGIVSRHRTHPEDISLSALLGENDFQTGMRVHAWVDATRAKYLEEKNIKESLPWHPFVPHALKLAEDQLLYETFPDWDDVLRSLKTVYADETFYVPEKSIVERWHTIMKNYLSQPPSDETRARLSRDIGLSASSAQEINSVVESLLANKKTPELVSGLTQYIEDTL